MGEVSATGTITNVQTKFAFISSDKGTVFCPLAASVDPKDNVVDMLHVYSIGDIVHFKAVPQSDKNGCPLRATHLRKSAYSSAYQGIDVEDAVRNDVEARITLVQETLAYGINEQLGAVFIPGSAFSQELGTRLNSFLEIGNMVMLSITRQAQRNDCRWRAINARMCEMPSFYKGFGKVTSVSPTVALVASKDWGTVRCPILTWVGGPGRGEGESLYDVVQFGDDIVMEATENEYGSVMALRWSLARLGLEASPVVDKKDSSTQTIPSIEHMFIRSISKGKRRELLECSPFIGSLLNEVYPDSSL